MSNASIIDEKTKEVIARNVIWFSNSVEWERFDRLRNEKFSSFQSGLLHLIYGFDDIPDSPISILSPQSLVRLMFLVSHCSHENNKLCVRGTDNYIKFPALKKITMLKGVMFDEFKNDIIGNELIVEDSDGYIMLNPKYFKRKKANYLNETKIIGYDYAIRSLYEQNKRKYDSQLWYAYKMIPYISRRYNTACMCPEKKDIDDIKIISAFKFCDYIGVDSSDIQKAEDMFSNIKIDGNRIVRFVEFDNKEKIVITNPKLFCAYNMLCDNYATNFVFSKLYDYIKITVDIDMLKYKHL